LYNFVDCLASLHEFLECLGHRFTVTYLNVTHLVNRCVIFLVGFLLTVIVNLTFAKMAEFLLIFRKLCVIFYKDY